MNIKSTLYAINNNINFGSYSHLVSFPKNGGESAIENNTLVEISGQHNSNAVNQSSLCFTFLMLIYSCGWSYMYCIIPSGKCCQIDCYRLLITGVYVSVVIFIFMMIGYYYIQFLASLRKSHFCIYFLIKEKDVVLIRRHICDMLEPAGLASTSSSFFFLQWV